MLTKLPDLTKSAKMLVIATKLEKVKEDTIFGYSIKRSLENGKIKGVISMIRDQAKDNRQMLSEIVGEDTLREIESLNL